MSVRTRPKRESYFTHSERPDANSVRYANTTRRDFLKLAGGVSALAAANYMSPLLGYVLKPFIPKSIEGKIQERLGVLTYPLPKVNASPVAEQTNQTRPALMNGYDDPLSKVSNSGNVQKSAFLSSTPFDYVECYFYHGDTVTAPLVPDSIFVNDAERSENAWNYAEMRDLTPLREQDKGTSSKFWLLYNKENLSIYVENYSSHSIHNDMFCGITLDTRADGFRKTPYCSGTPEEDDFAIFIAPKNGTTIFGYPSNKAVPFLDEVKAAIHYPSSANDFVKYKISIPLDTLQYYQTDRIKLQRAGIRLAVYDYNKELAVFPQSDGISFLDFSEIPVPEMPPWALGAALVTGLAGASYVSSLINKRQY
jgi:hypothetical protein